MHETIMLFLMASDLGSTFFTIINFFAQLLDLRLKLKLSKRENIISF